MLHLIQPIHTSSPPAFPHSVLSSLSLLHRVSRLSRAPAFVRPLTRFLRTPTQQSHILGTTPLFTLPGEELQELATHFKERRFTAGQTIYQEDTGGDRFYVVESGVVDIFARHGSSELMDLAPKKQGEFFGDQALFDAAHIRSTTAVAASDCLLLELRRDKFDKYLLSAAPGMRKKIQSIICVDMTDVLVNIEFLKGVSHEDLQLLGSMFHYVTLQQGETLFTQGELGTELYVIAQGSVKITALNELQENTEIACLYEGQYFGEIALMVNMPRTASVTALEDALLLSLEKRDFERFISFVPEIKDSFDLVAKQRTAELFQKFDVPFFKSIPMELFQELASLCEIAEYHPDEMIFQEGEVGSTFYIIIFGRVDVTVRNGDNPGHLVTLGPGKYFGEVALVQDVERTASVKALTRCVMLAITRERFVKFFKKYPDTFSDFEIKLARHEVNLEPILKHHMAIEYFAAHLDAEYSGENLEFWRALQEFKKIPDDHNHRMELHDTAVEIVDKYVRPNSELQVNLPSEFVAPILRHIENDTVKGDLFEDAEEEIFTLMSKDSFKRFKASKRFEELLERLDSYVQRPASMSNSASVESLRIEPRASRAGKVVLEMT